VRNHGWINFDLNRYRSILSTSTSTIYSKAYYGAYLKHDSEWKAIGLTCEKSAENDHLRVVQMMIEREIPAKAAAANSLDENCRSLAIAPAPRRFQK